jgi:phenylpyruvate tautomerase PptA (4-oxalocrotonate tautomerase family)
MPFVRVSWWAGGKSEDKDKVAAMMTETMLSVGISAEATHVVFEEVPREDWYIAGVSAPGRQQPAR